MNEVEDDYRFDVCVLIRGQEEPEVVDQAYTYDEAMKCIENLAIRGHACELAEWVGNKRYVIQSYHGRY